MNKNSLNRDVDKKVDFVTGADLFISKDMFFRINGFDEKFFMYHEDDDLCRRAKEIGCNSFLIAAPKIVHLEGKSSKNSAKKMIIRERSFLYYLKKNSSERLFVFFCRLYKLFVFLRFFSPVFTLHEKIKMSQELKALLRNVKKDSDNAL